jgi:ATP synthase protein I
MVEQDREPTTGITPDDEHFRRLVAEKEQRKIRARRKGDRGPWFWLGMFGLVGWSVAIPMLVGTFLGAWLDRRFPGRISWTLTLLFVGTVVGCMTAWYWVRRESQRS